MRWLLLGALLGLVLAVPELAAAATAMVGAAAIWCATQPAALGFAAGVLAGPRITNRIRGAA